MIIEILFGFAIIILAIWLCFISKDIIELMKNQREFLKFNVENSVDIKKLYKMFKVQTNLNDKIMSLIDKMYVKQDEPKKIFKGTKNEQVIKE